MKKKFRSGCPISSALDVVGDKWSLLIIRDMLVKHKKTFREISNSDEKIAPSILSARLKLLESYKLIFKTKVPDNKKENIYLLTEKGIHLTPIIIEFSLWGNSNMREFNEIDDIEGLNSDKNLVIQTVQESYNSMLLNFRTGQN
ncbi:MAG: helix-turn-helix transcriptional regulator [Flavobacterium sp.]|nr:helix-turn-helix transcriptional regulator [Flavobacterium sp.]